MLTVVDEKQGIPLAVVKGGRPSKGDTIWLGGAPYCVTGHDRDVVLVKFGGWKSPYCATGTQIRHKALYAVNPPPGDNPPLPEDLPKYKKGPVFQQGYPQTPFLPPSQPPFIPQMGFQPTFDPATLFSQPDKYTAYHEKFKFPVFELQSYRPPKIGEKDTFQGIEYEYVHVGRDFALVRPVVPWLGFVVAEDKRTGEGLAWAPFFSWEHLPQVRQWLNARMKERNIRRGQYHLFKKSGRQLKKYFRDNPPKGLPIFRRA